MKTWLNGHVPVLSFLAGVAAGALTYLASGKHELALVAFVIVWYALAYALPRTLAHPEHRRGWIVHVVLFPLVWIAGVVYFEHLVGHLLAAVALGAAAAGLAQLVVTQFALHTVRDDQLHDLRHRMGIE